MPRAGSPPSQWPTLFQAQTLLPQRVQKNEGGFLKLNLWAATRTKNRGLGGLGDCGALFFLALPSESSRSTCDVADARLLLAWDALAHPGRLEESPAVPRSGPRGGGLADAEVGEPGPREAARQPAAPSPPLRSLPRACGQMPGAPRLASCARSPPLSPHFPPPPPPPLPFLKGKAAASSWAPHPRLS